MFKVIAFIRGFLYIDFCMCTVQDYGHDFGSGLVTVYMWVQEHFEWFYYPHFSLSRSFQDHVETPITLIQAGMNPIGTLHAFSRGTAACRTSSQYHHYPTPS